MIHEWGGKLHDGLFELMGAFVEDSGVLPGGMADNMKKTWKAEVNDLKHIMDCFWTLYSQHAAQIYGALFEFFKLGKSSNKMSHKTVKALYHLTHGGEKLHKTVQHIFEAFDPGGDGSIDKKDQALCMEAGLDLLGGILHATATAEAAFVANHLIEPVTDWWFNHLDDHHEIEIKHVLLLMAEADMLGPFAQIVHGRHNAEKGHELIKHVQDKFGELYGGSDDWAAFVAWQKVTASMVHKIRESC